MRRVKLFVWLAAAAASTSVAANAQDWGQWMKNAQHTGAVSSAGQASAHVLADVVYDPFVDQEKADPLAAPDLLVHYQAPLIDGNNVYMEFKTGTYTKIQTWETQIWNERRLSWQGGSLNTVWSFQSDWKPVPYGTALLGPAWEPVFHSALAGNFIYVPGFAGSIYKLNKSTGAVVARIQPFGSDDPNTFTCGPLTTDSAGNVYYNTIKVVNGQAWNADVRGSWLVKVSASGAVSTADYTTLIPGAPGGNDKCLGVFKNNELPWPPTPDAVPATVQCGTQRAAVNLAPAVAPDGTIYTVSVAHLTSRTGYMVALNPNLTLKWATSLRDRLNTGCNVTLPPNGALGGCRVGAHDGVDPAQNRPGAGRVIEDSTASPVVAPDGSIFWGAYTRYNYFQGHLMKFAPDGTFLATFPFGWDTTPAIYVHDGTYSVITKNNHYSDGGSYCNVDSICPPDRTASNPADPEAYFITQLSKDLVPEWSWQNTNPLSCTRDAAGNVSCVSDHPAGFEWCINGPAVDRNGVVYANSEDGGLYTIQQGGTLRDHLFLNLALGAAYTPVAIGADGKIYTQNDGHMFVIGR
jgi:hypothetical protein